MHFATALPDADGVSVNVFGAGSNVNGVYESTMTICQYNTQSSSWKQIISPVNAPLARRNAAYEFTHTNLTFIFGKYDLNPNAPCPLNDNPFRRQL